MATQARNAWLLAGGLLAVALLVVHGWVRHGPPTWFGVVFAGSGDAGPGAMARATSSARPKRKRDAEAAHIGKAGDLACEFDNRHGRRPLDMAEVQDWAVKEGKATPQDFRSTRDGQPYEFLNSALVVIEHSGRHGRRFAYHPHMGATEVTEAVLKLLAESGVVKEGARPNPTHAPTPRECCRPLPPLLH
jgi:hypothetical protein